MAFSHSSNTDARGSTFNCIGRDQTHNRTTIIQINFSLFGSGQGSHLPIGFIDSDPSRPISGANTSPTNRQLVTINHFDAFSDVDTAVGLIVQITHLLIDCRDTSNNHRDLAIELKSLHQTLTITGLAIKEYKGRPLGQSLANMIAPEVEQCCTVLREMLGRVNGTWLGLNNTTISSLWRPVWWRRWGGDEMVLLRRQLTHSRKALEGFLIAIHSYVFLIFFTLGHPLRYYRAFK